MKLYFQRYPERYDEVTEWCENHEYEMDSSLQVTETVCVSLFCKYEKEDIHEHICDMW